MSNQHNSLLWQILPPNQQNLSYIFGSIHLRDKRVFKWESELKLKIGKCTRFLAEIDLQEVNSLELAGKFQSMHNLDLQAEMGVKKYFKLKKILKKSFELDIDPYKKMNPIILLQMIGETQFTKDAPAPLDMVLWNYAKTIGKELTGLETVSMQHEVMRGMDPKDSIKQLKSLSKNIPKFRKSMKDLITAYGNQNIKRLYNLAKKSLGRQRKALLYNRNEIMVHSIIKNTSEETCFIAVGAGHLPGKAGILRLLKQNGFRLHPVVLKD